MLEHLRNAASAAWFSVATPNYTLELIKAVPTLMVGVIATIIAWRLFANARQQRAIAASKLRLDLFDRRYDIYSKGLALISSPLPHEGRDATVRDFVHLRQQAFFMFGKKVHDFLQTTMWDEAEQIFKLDARIRDTNEKEQRDAMQKQRDMLSDALSTRFTAMVAPYMDFSEWKK